MAPKKEADEKKGEETGAGTQVSTFNEPGSQITGKAVFGGIEDISLALWTSMPLTRRAEIVTLLQGQTAKLGDNIGEVFKVEHILAHRVEMVNTETGEVTEGDRIVLVTADGKSYAGVSEGLRKSLQLIMAVYGMPPWKGGLALKVGQINTRRGFRTYTLSPVEESK